MTDDQIRHWACGGSIFHAHRPSRRRLPTLQTAPDPIRDLPSAIATAAHRAGFRWQARREAARLRRVGDAVALRLAGALDDALAAPPSPSAAWAQRIEALREDLLRADEAVSFQDYGAGGSAGGPSRNVTRTVGEVCRSSVPPHQAWVLFHLIRAFEPQVCLELGTCLGISGAYQAAALGDAGRLVTLEGGAALARRAETHFDRLGLRNVEVVAGRFADTLPAVLAAHGPIDYAFIDGHHEPAALRAYYQQLAPHLADQALIVFDDLFWTKGLRRAWTMLAAAPPIRLTVDLLTFGVGFFQRDAPE